MNFVAFSLHKRSCVISIILVSCKLQLSVIQLCIKNYMCIKGGFKVGGSERRKREPRRRRRRGRVKRGEGVSASPLGERSEEGAVLPSQKFF